MIETRRKKAIDLLLADTRNFGALDATFLARVHCLGALVADFVENIPDPLSMRAVVHKLGRVLATPKQFKCIPGLRRAKIWPVVVADMKSPKEVLRQCPLDTSHNVLAFPPVIKATSHIRLASCTGHSSRCSLQKQRHVLLPSSITISHRL